jgi:hypothetical protein
MPAPPAPHRGYGTQWDNFFHQLAPLASRMPYMTAPGNHERDWPGSGDKYNWGYDSGGECGVAYETLLTMPTPGRDQPWYAFDFGPIHFVQYSTEHDFAPGGWPALLGVLVCGTLWAYVLG